MNIILEGPDSGGKSTLALYLQQKLGEQYRIQTGNGPPRNADEINERVRQYLDMRFTIFDRHPCVSQPIYEQLRSEPPHIEPRLLALFDEQTKVVIYCRTLELRNHQIKLGEDPGHIRLIEDKFYQLVLLYDQWALYNADIIYRKDSTLFDRLKKAMP